LLTFELFSQSKFQDRLQCAYLCRGESRLILWRILVQTPKVFIKL
jgi:hypothetical protein